MRWVIAALAACGGEASAPRSPLEPPPPGTGFQLDEGAFTIEPGQEGLYCMRLPSPAECGDAPVFVREIESQLPIGTHHFFMAYRGDHVDAATGCFESGPFVSTTDAEAHGG